MSKKKQTVTLALSENEALDLFEFLSRFSDKDDLCIEDQAEARVLWDLCCLLEKQLVQSVSGDYAVLLKRAREDVRDTDAEGAI